MKQSTGLLLSLLTSASVITGCGNSSPTPNADQQKKLDSLSTVYMRTLTETFSEAKIAYTEGNVKSAELVLARKEAEINKENPTIRLELEDTSTGTRSSRSDIVRAYAEIDDKLFPFYRRQF